ncbi:hypothetical protein [uncultured Aquimarina sp.]|uniref:hypothetical protein n=1 Tax=uncultured Aquimarina sp. TaxID=575652 RepID=UPI002612CD23|nr:hypothetical protein [uncultured Aquimarina sp.]
MKKIVLITLLMQTLCVSAQYRSPKRMVFQHNSTTSESTINKVSDSLKKFRKKDTTMVFSKEQEDLFRELLSITKTALRKPNSYKTFIEIKNDTIWKYKTVKGKQIGDYHVKFKKDSTKHMVGKDRKTFYITRNLKFSNAKHTITEYPNDTKLIKGISCYKMIIEIEALDNKEDFSPFGKTIHELYVTKELDLPMHTFFNYDRMMLDVFPLEISIKHENFTGNKDSNIITLSEIVF